MALKLDIDPRGYTFIDFGSGKGRVLLLASEYPYKKIIGVEFAEELHQIALKNIRNYRSRSQRCRDVESIHMDAAEYEIPPHTPLVLHFFNPFGPPVMSRVVANLQSSIDEHPRQVFMIYHSPRHTHLLEQLRNIQLIKGGPWYRIYKISGPTEAVDGCHPLHQGTR